MILGHILLALGGMELTE